MNVQLLCDNAKHINDYFEDSFYSKNKEVEDFENLKLKINSTIFSK